MKKTTGIPMNKSLDRAQESWIGLSKFNSSLKNMSSKSGRCYVFFKKEKTLVKKTLSEVLEPWQLDHYLNKESDISQFLTSQGNIWVLNPCHALKPRPSAYNGETSEYGEIRDLMGRFFNSCVSSGIEELEINLGSYKKTQLEAMVLGLETSAYCFKSKLDDVKVPFLLIINVLGNKKIKVKEVQAYALKGCAMNLSRHLVNLPPNVLNPKTYSEYLKKMFTKVPHTKMEIWDEKRLEKEKMNLILAVGKGSDAKPCMVHIKYRPKSSKKPMAFVGKGITFDSGGLNLKPSTGMRLMKKDMGGSATLVGVAYWVIQSQPKQPMDFYLPMAENLVDEDSFRPSDVYVARNGMSVEIHNTDAEGRLLLADALDVAVTQKGKDKPQIVVNAATLTGAIKVGLGSEIAGLFSTDEKLSKKLEKSAFEKSDKLWRMPLYEEYRKTLNSHFADISNAANGFGGAIRAALFLKEFVGDTPWAHLDIYAWRDSPKGSINEVGGSGQGVQCLIHFIENFK